MVAQVRRQFAERQPQLLEDVWVDRKPMPVRALPMHTDAAANEVDVLPPAGTDLGTSQTRPSMRRIGGRSYPRGGWRLSASS